DLLLVAARELPGDARDRGRLDVQAAPEALGHAVLLVVVDPAAVGELGEAGGRDVALDVLDQVEPVALPVFGGVGDAQPDRVGHRAHLDRLAVLEHAPGDADAVGPAEHAHRQLGAPRPHQPGQPDDLAAPQ